MINHSATQQIKIKPSNEAKRLCDEKSYVESRNKAAPVYISRKPAERLSIHVCDHRGSVIARCPLGDGGSIFRCDKLGRSCKPRKGAGSLVADLYCESCEHHSDYERIGEVRHLVYWLCPVRGDIWRNNVRQLLQRIHLFNGKKIIGVAVKGQKIHVPKMRPVSIDMEPFDEVAKAFEGYDCQLIPFPNDPNLGEVVGWVPMFDMVLPGGEFDVTFYGHAKGVRREGHPTCHKWTELMYCSLLDYWPEVQKILQKFPVAGSFKKDGHCFTGAAGASRWHYSGSFIWVRNADMAVRRWKAAIPRLWAGTEAVWGILYDSSEAGVVFHGGHGAQVELYDPTYWNAVVEPAWEFWKFDRESSRGNHLPVNGPSVQPSAD